MSSPSPQANPRLILASASPRRRELLASIGLECQVVAASIDESVRAGEEPVAYARRLAAAKALAIPRRGGELVLAADTVVIQGAEIFGKPLDDADARRMLARLAGGVHQVVTAVAVVGPTARDPLAVDHEATRVTVAALSAELIAAYVATGEPRDKAGAYAVQGLFGAWIERLEGTWSNVVGLPLPRTRGLLEQRGFCFVEALRQSAQNAARS